MPVVGSYVMCWDVCGWKLRDVLGFLVDCVRLFMVFRSVKLFVTRDTLLWTE